MQEMQVRSLGLEDPLEEEMATPSSVLAWEIPRTEGPGGLYSPWGYKESDMTQQLSHHRQHLLALMRRHMSKHLSKFIKTVLPHYLKHNFIPNIQPFMTKHSVMLLCLLGQEGIFSFSFLFFAYLSFYVLFKPTFSQSGRLQNLDYFSL